MTAKAALRTFTKMKKILFRKLHVCNNTLRTTTQQSYTFYSTQSIVDHGEDFMFNFSSILCTFCTFNLVSVCVLAVVLIWSLSVLKSALDSASPFQCNPPFSLHLLKLSWARARHKTTQNHTLISSKPPRNQTHELTSGVRSLFGDVVVETSFGRSYFQTLKSLAEARETHAFQHIALAQPALAGEAWRHRARSCSRALKVYYCVLF